MHRRTCLAALAGLFSTAGCAQLSAVSNDPQQRDAADGPLMISSISASTPEDSSVALSATVIREAITPEETARVAIEYTNTGDSTVTININPDKPDPLHSVPRDETPGLYLIPDGYSPTRASGECWKAAESLPVQASITEYDLPSGESVQMEYDVWGSPKQSAACIQTDAYELSPPEGAVSLTISE